MADKPKILCVGQPAEGGAHLLDLDGEFEVVHTPTPLRALRLLAREKFHAIHIHLDEATSGLELIRIAQSQRMLDSMPDGVALLDGDSRVIWANDCLLQWAGKASHEGLTFYQLLDDPDILGPEYCPFNSALATCESHGSLLKRGEVGYYRVHAAPIIDNEGPPQHLIVTVQDVTAETRNKQKMTAIHKAGIELSELTPTDIGDMGIEERIELVKQNIVHHTRDLLRFDVVEIRLIDQTSGQLVPLLSEGMREDATNRVLYAKPQDNGVTGFVAATGKSYLCEDTLEDPLYIEGSDGAKSSLTVPLIQHDDVIGTINVESPKPRAFTESDLQFLEIFSRDIAAALNTLELLVAQQANTAMASVEAIHGEVALPVDEILNDAVNVMERYIGHEPEVVERLQRILRNARDIKQVIHKVGEKMTPAEAVPESLGRSAWPQLKDKRILVVDEDESVRVAAHGLLERFGCVVETAHEGQESIFMVRSCLADAPYDAIIADIRLSDISGYDLLVKLSEILDRVPLILMSGFGYDPGHSIVKARQAGLLPNAVLYKPFRLDQLLSTVDSVINAIDNETLTGS